MPGGDRTGPLGRGPITGKGFGPCNAGRGRAGLASRFGFGPGRGRGFGLRQGLGINAGFNQYDTKTQQELLAEEKEMLQERLNQVRKQLENM